MVSVLPTVELAALNAANSALWEHCAAQTASFTMDIASQCAAQQSTFFLPWTLALNVQQYCMMSMAEHRAA